MKEHMKFFKCLKSETLTLTEENRIPTVCMKATMHYESFCATFLQQPLTQTNQKSPFPAIPSEFNWFPPTIAAKCCLESYVVHCGYNYEWIHELL